MLGDGEVVMRRVDISLSNDSFGSLCAGALKVLKHVKNWNLEKIKFKLYKDGITNHLLGCYLESNPEETVMIRVYGEKTELFIDRALEVRNMQLMYKAGLCSPLYCAFNNGLCYGFVPGEVLDGQMVRDPHISRLVAHRLAHMHSIKPQANGVLPQPSLFPVLHKYLQLVPVSFCDLAKDEKFKKFVPPKDQLEAEINFLKSHLTNLESPVVFCHNDLLLKNIIYNSKKDTVTFIDYEYADFNYQAFDIGNHFCEFAGVEKFEPHLYPAREFQLWWLRCYLEASYSVNGWNIENVADEDVEMLYVQVNTFAMAAHLFWGIWALIQATHSTLDFDFLGYAIERLNEYFSHKQKCLSLNFPG